MKQQYAETEAKMKVAIDHLHAELKRLRTGRATVGMLDGVQVEYYGSLVPLKNVATVTVADATMLVAQPFDSSQIQAIDRALRKSDLGINPTNDGKVIRIPVPQLTEERRKGLVKVVHKLAEEGRIAIRHARTDTLGKIKKLEHISEDDKTRAEKDVQKITDEHVKHVDEVIKSKEAEIMEV